MEISTLWFMDKKDKIWFVANFASGETAGDAMTEISKYGFDEYTIPNAPWAVIPDGPVFIGQLFISVQELDPISAEHVPVIA
jgi:hypothetical protein